MSDTLDLFALDEAKQRGKKAAKAVSDKTERIHNEWVAKSVEKLREFAHKQTGTFTIEKARAAIAAELPPPHDLRSWGTVTIMAKSLGIIVLAGTKPAASSHGSLKPAYRRGISA